MSPVVRQLHAVHIAQRYAQAVLVAVGAVHNHVVLTLLRRQRVVFPVADNFFEEAPARGRAVGFLGAGWHMEA